ncbi:zinc-dependent alcohol dehydrogenase [Paenibacillus roseipurpureus]|uniref:Alcohol dehydrogenase catalytic domain-containing protein n=1 Tax=Paenibacillus roseopurpureus TaxID=2918901 RepID=A0AA96LJG3_9BACL|nr:alcohol dehydrogenase catalytic domain-containing protein [Paenibacillus sp. MBLB1832]WNR42855.1 alcohol dehydrogenase catalytic domain-containing protein [Paenibacillus sp. MBLB1832]
MRALVLHKPGELKLEQIPIPSCGSKEVLIELKTSCICNGSDPAILAGAHWETFPIVFGHEACGTIVACGDQVTQFQIGDRVAWWFTVGAFAEYVSVTPEHVAMVKLPETISDDEGPLFELAGAAIRAVEAAKIKAGDKVLIVGLGPSGLIMSQLAKNLGASTVIGWDLYGMRRELGLQLGCDGVFDNGACSVREAVINQFGEMDVVIDAYADDLLPGSPTLNDAIAVIRQGGTLISYGHPQQGRMIDIFDFQKKQVIMRGPVNDMQLVRLYFQKAVDYAVEGKLKLAPLISGRVSLDHVMDGLELVMNHPETNLKILVDIQ